MVSTKRPPERERKARTEADARLKRRRYGHGRPPIHGLWTLRTAVRTLGDRVIDRRTKLGKALAAWKGDLIRDLGGAVSTQQAAVVELAVRTKLLLDSVDAWLLTQPSLVNMRKRALLPVVLQRQQLADSLCRMLRELGLERKTKEEDVHAIMRRLQGPPQVDGGGKP